MDEAAHGNALFEDDRRAAAVDLPDPEEGTRTWKALLVVTVPRSKARTAVAVESTLILIDRPCCQAGIYVGAPDDELRF